jgi:hypothetical protein
MPTKEEEYKLVIFVYSCSFLYLYKETNQQCFLRRKKYSRSLAASLLFRFQRITLRCSKKSGAAKIASLKQS